MMFNKPDAAYWDRKFIAYMHDPLDKVFRIPGHEERGALFLEKYGLQKPNEEFWKKADAIAAGFERGQVPSYSPDRYKNGAIDFLKNPVITHPTSRKAHLKIILNGSLEQLAEHINEQLIHFIEKDIGMKPGAGGYSDKFKGDEDRFANARFLYTHLILRFKLAEQNIGGLGGLWHRLPADSRFPDHSIWQHNALCAALCSCLEMAGNASGIGLMVFSITPVQPFIAKARKLRDYWTGSVLLSWLAFEGMRWVIENLGPDHILYPSLIDQPLVNEYMKKYWRISEDGLLNTPKGIATLPNKFLFMLPVKQAESIAGEIKKQIRREWKSLYERVCNTCTSLMGDLLSESEKDYVRQMFNRQNRHFWNLQWACAGLVSIRDRVEIEKLLPKRVWDAPFNILERFNEIIKDKAYDKSGHGVLYCVSHSLSQSAVAATKNRRTVTRQPETGEKCHLCGEFEVLHHKPYGGDISTGEYKENARSFWGKLKQKWDGDEGNDLGYNLNKNEMLCSICLTKRMAPLALEKDDGHILHSVFTGGSGFPSTIEIALTGYFDRNRIPVEKRKEIAQKLHEQADEKTDNRDRYFAILVMDGDRMGDLVSGKTLGSTWESVMHPEIVSRLKDPSFEAIYHKNWSDVLGKKRLVTPAIHAAISESLGDFSLYGVSEIINRYLGRLIYAGGDDVCAVLPVENALLAAWKIKDYYTSIYKWIQKGRRPEDISGTWEPGAGKLSINLGKGENISISSGILICHHKESLSHMISEAHHLLDEKAKKKWRRNACAIELRKRSGGSRFFVRKWDDQAAWRSFLEIGSAIKSKKKAQVSSSLVYRLEGFRNGINAMLKQPNYKDMLESFIAAQLDRSSVGDREERKQFAEKMIDIVVFERENQGREYDPEGLIIAAFMSRGDPDDELV